MERLKSVYNKQNLARERPIWWVFPAALGPALILFPEIILVQRIPTPPNGYRLPDGKQLGDIKH